MSIGVAQGSVFGPLLVNIRLNNLFYMELKSEMFSFSDDVTIYTRDTSVETVMIRLEGDLQLLMH